MLSFSLISSSSTMSHCSPTIAAHCLTGLSTLPSLYYSSSVPKTSSSAFSLAVASSSASSWTHFSCYYRGHGLSSHFKKRPKLKGLKISCSTSEPLKVMISGAPASGKGTQCEIIVQKFGLVHVSTGDLLRAEVAAGTEIGKQAKEYMNSGRLVPDDIVTAMVKDRLSKPDAKERGWLLDGYPRTAAQARSLEELNIRPDVYIMLDVPDEILMNRCVGRRLDPVTRRIYHVTHFLPENEEIKERLVTRLDDTEEKVKSRLQIYKQNVEAILPTYIEILNKIDGNRPKEDVFKDLDSLLLHLQKNKGKILLSSGQSNKPKSSKEYWRGIPTKLNNIPHSREIREYFYNDVQQATTRAVNDGKTRLKVLINIPELNPEMLILKPKNRLPLGEIGNRLPLGENILVWCIGKDVYRIGTLMELVRVLALSFADDGKRVKVCVQGSMGEGALSGMPLQLAGSRKILEYMDWGEYGAKDTFIKIGSIGAKEVDEEDDIFILVAPQNAVGNCIIEDLQAMTIAAGDNPVILVNPRLKDVPGSSGIMQTMGRDKRLEYAATFEICYFFRLLYYYGTQYPIMGALRMSYPCDYELYKRVDKEGGKEKYVILSKFSGRPSGEEINDAFEGKTRSGKQGASGFWNLFSNMF